MNKLVLCALLISCGGASPLGYQIEKATPGPLEAAAGDAVQLRVVQRFSDGTTVPLPPDLAAQVVWGGAPSVAALDPSSTADSPLPAPGADPTAVFLQNPGRSVYDGALRGVLFVLDPGTAASPRVPVTAQFPGGTLSADLAVDPVPSGDPIRGGALYSANCARCHGANGEGSPANSDGTSTIGGGTWPTGAPGLNAAEGNPASDPGWNLPLFAMAARADVDNGGLTLTAPMPNYLVQADDDNGRLLSTQDFADIFAWLGTQTVSSSAH